MIAETPAMRKLSGLLLLIFPVLLSASSVAQVTFDELVQSSELIFEGQVIGERERRGRGGHSGLNHPVCAYRSRFAIFS
jgi:hypothetical protein